MPITPCDPFRVRCIHGNRDHVQAGAEYLVAETFETPGGTVYGLHKHWPGHLFGAWRFERVEEPAS